MNFSEACDFINGSRERYDAYAAWRKSGGIMVPTSAVVAWAEARQREEASKADQTPASPVQTLPAPDWDALHSSIVSVTTFTIEAGRRLDGVTHYRDCPRDGRWYENTGSGWTLSEVESRHLSVVRAGGKVKKRFPNMEHAEQDPSAARDEIAMARNPVKRDAKPAPVVIAPEPARTVHAWPGALTVNTYER